MPADIRELVQAAAPSPSSAVDVESMWRRGRRMHRVRLGAAVMLATMLGAGTWMLIETGIVSQLLTSEQAEPAERGNWTGWPEGWSELPPPPEVRGGAALVWTGTELLAWGGCEAHTDCTPTAGGYAFDPASGEWKGLPQAPAAGAYGSATWTGLEAIFLAGDAGSPLEAVAFDPASRTWRAAAPAPIVARHGAVSVWTGSELIVWGGGDRGDPANKRGAAYEPSSDTWRLIAEAPLGLNLASGLWTGEEMLVFGSLLDGNNLAETRYSVGAAYDPAADSWREIAPSELSPQATSAVLAGGRMVAWDYEVRSQEYDAAADAWSPPVEMPLDFSECYPDSVAARARVFAFFRCGRAALYDTAAGTWEEIDGGPLEDEIQGGAGSYPLWRFASLVSTGDAVLMAMEGLTIEDGEACYGCPGSPTALWAYRPIED